MSSALKSGLGPDYSVSPQAVKGWSRTESQLAGAEALLAPYLPTTVDQKVLGQQLLVSFAPSSVRHCRLDQ